MNRQKGQTTLIAVMVVLLLVGAIVIREVSSVIQSSQSARRTNVSREVAFTAESGTEDVTYRIKQELEYDDEETLSIDDYVATTTVEDVSGSQKVVTSEADIRNNVRAKESTLIKGQILNFNYAVIAGDGGIEMDGNSYVRGNMHSNEIVTANSNNDVYGDVVAAGSEGLVIGVNSTSSVYAHTIRLSFIEGDAYYDSELSGSTVLGTEYPNSPDPAPINVPIGDEVIDLFEVTAEDGGIYSAPCPYTIEVFAILGPIKIECDLTIKKNAVVFLAGPVLVEGNVVFQNNAQISPLGNVGIVIAHDPSDLETGSTIELKNNVEISGLFPTFLISRNTSAENSGNVVAISAQNNEEGDIILYAPRGRVEMGNNSGALQATGYEVHLDNNSSAQMKEAYQTIELPEWVFGATPWELDNWVEIE